MTQNLWHEAKAVLRGKFIAIQSYLKKQPSNRQPDSTPKASGKRKRKKRQQKERKIRAEINEKEMKETMKIHKTKSWFFEKIKLTNYQPDSSRKKWEKNEINKIRNEIGEVTTEI